VLDSFENLLYSICRFKVRGGREGGREGGKNEGRKPSNSEVKGRAVEEGYVLDSFENVAYFICRFKVRRGREGGREGGSGGHLFGQSPNPSLPPSLPPFLPSSPLQEYTGHCPTRITVVSFALCLTTRVT